MTSEDSFTKRPGTTDRGKEYEDNVLGYLILKFLNNKSKEKFYLCSNHDHFGAFDDIVVEANENLALQLKHVKSSGRGSLKNMLSGPSGNFSIQKYCQDFKKIQISSYKFVLFTNQKFDIDNETKITLSNNLIVRIYKTERVFKIFKTKGHYFRFEIEDNQEHEELADYKEFFESFLLYTDQLNVDEVKLEVLRKFQDMFKCDNGLAEKFIYFVTEWSKVEGKKKKLDCEFLKEAIGLILLGPFIKPITYGSQFKSEKIDIFKRIISGFDITFLKKQDLPTIQDIWGHLGPPKIDKINKIGREYKFLTQPISNINNVDAIIKNKFFWLCDEAPLIIEANKITIEAINLCQKHKFILIGKTSNLDTKLTLLCKFTDLDLDSENFRTVLKTYTCKLKNNSELILDALLKKNI